MPYQEIKALAEFKDLIEDDITKVPCHTQATERHIKDVTRVAHTLTSKKSREGAVAVTLESRKNRPKFDSKRDFN